MRTCMLLCAFVVHIYRFSYMTQFILSWGGGGSDQTVWICRLIFLSAARKFLLNKLAFYQAMEKQGTERTVQMCVLICLIAGRKHDKILLIHCLDIALKRLHSA